MLRVQRPTGEKTAKRKGLEGTTSKTIVCQNVDDDSDLVTQVAAQLVSEFGAEAAAYTWDQAEIAVGLDDEESARAWFDIVDAADDLLRKPT
jgi:hypothetical protein